VAATLGAGCLAIAPALASDTPEPGSAEAIARDTTRPEFLSPWVASIPASDSVPSPSHFLGRVPGAAGELARSAEVQDYFRRLAAASPRVSVETLGESEEGRPILMAAIADAAGIADLARLKRATAALADPRRTPPGEAERLIAGARPIYYLNAAIHADESGSPEMAMELAYRLAVSEEPMFRRIRERLVVLINPVSEPDGRDKFVDWFYRYLKGRSDYAALPRQSPPYWGRYVYVDINRDAHQLAFQATRAVSRMFFDYHPTVVHDLHEAIAYLQTWNGTGPYNPNLDPIATNEFLEMSLHEMTTLSGLGMPGVWTWDFGDGFGHHYLDSVAMNHNSIGRGYETFGNATAETVEREIDPSSTTREWYRPWPPERRFRWSMRDGVNYMQTGCLAILDHSARHADQLLRNFYRKGWNSWQAGVHGSPRAFVIPPEQGDRRRVAEMIGLLLAQHIEVARSAAALELDEGRFPAGSYVVPLAQPYRNYAVDLLRRQHFPADSPHLPYDDVSWALPFHFGVEAVAVDDPRVGDAVLEPLAEPPLPPGRVAGDGPVYLLRDTGQEALLAARARLRGFEVEIAEAPFSAGAETFAPGSWVLPARDGLRSALEDVASELGLDFRGAPAVPAGPRHPAPLPRIGLLVPWADTDSIGWIRYVLDRQAIPYRYLRDEDVRAGGLGDHVDVIVYGHVRLDLQAQIHGIEPVTGPMPFTSTEAFPSHGAPVASDDVTGGLGWRGLAELERFVEEGGLLITLGQGSTLALDGGLVRHVRRADAGVRTPGVELRTRFTRPDHPLAYGYPETPSVFRSGYAVYDLPRAWTEMSYCTSCLDGPFDTSAVVLQWGTGPLAHEAGAAEGGSDMLLSGGARNLAELAGRPAILDAPLGRGRVLAFNFNPLHRDLNRSDHRLLWNALLNWRAIAGSGRE
jgi:hypothetical protein